MDLMCANCGEVWDTDTVLHDEPWNFERRGGLISKCPCCEECGPRDNPDRPLLEALADIMGDDIDGYAAELEDLQVFGVI